MSQAALKEFEPVHDTPANVRRFGLGDLTTHGAWLLKRLLTAFPQQNERTLAGWLRGMLDSNESLFLYSDNGCALFQTSSAHSLEPKPWVWERFVFVLEGHTAEGIEFYRRAHDWAKSQGIEQIVVEVMSDVPHDAIKDTIGRIYNRQQAFVRV